VTLYTIKEALTEVKTWLRRHTYEALKDPLDATEKALQSIEPENVCDKKKLFSNQRQDPCFGGRRNLHFPPK